MAPSSWLDASVPPGLPRITGSPTGSSSNLLVRSAGGSGPGEEGRALATQPPQELPTAPASSESGQSEGAEAGPATFLPTLRRFGLSQAWAPLLPLIAVFYMAATLGSALDHHRGRGVVWKNRAYTEGEA